MSGQRDQNQYNKAGGLPIRTRLIGRLLAAGLSVAAVACGSDTGRIRLTVDGEKFDVELP